MARVPNPTLSSAAVIFLRTVHGSFAGLDSFPAPKTWWRRDEGSSSGSHNRSYVAVGISRSDTDHFVELAVLQSGSGIAHKGAGLAGSQAVLIQALADDHGGIYQHDRKQ